MKTTVSQVDRITGDRLRDWCCEHTYVPSAALPHHPGKAFIIFCKTDYVLSFFAECIKNFSTQYILVTQNSDINIGERLFKRAPPNVYRWFAQNVDYKNPRLISIPIGSTGATWIGIEKYADRKDIHDFVLIKETLAPKKFQNLVYMNFGIHTNPQHRRPIYEHFKDKPWVTEKACDIPPKDYEKSDGFVSIKDYYQELYNHKFVISPLGNGVDCGRVWQAIYVGAVPIIPRHINIEFYEDLPILVYNDVKELTEKYLNEQYDYLIGKKTNLQKATLSYWKKRFSEEKYNAAQF